MLHQDYVNEVAMRNPSVEVIGHYRGMKSTIALRCKECAHEWAPTASNVLYQKTRCPICSGSKLTAQAFKEKCKKSSPQYKITGSYKRGKGKIQVQCKNCGYEYMAYKDVLLRGCNCKLCSIIGSSKQEIYLFCILKALFGEDNVLWREK